MEYHNPQPPEGINVSQTHPLLDFLRLLGGLLVIAAIVFTALALLADKLAKYIPFEREREIASRFADDFPASGPVSTYLQQLADRVVAAQELPAGMRIRVQYVDNSTVNAFATLGGNIVFFRGLVGKMPSENALAMVVSHEIAHVKLRHPISTLGRGLAIGIVVAMVSAGSGSDIVGRTLGNAGLLTALTFSRSQESAADADALRTLARMYGHVAGANEVFTLLQKESARGTGNLPAVLRTHPLDQDRIDAIARIAAANGWPMLGPTQALPEEIRRLVEKPKE
ncbi:MAG TPA: M48 family metallopeptidase [Burkholderiales bacterium]|nr:M48 family metallopeptidase [Burkholderiales bacterium]